MRMLVVAFVVGASVLGGGIPARAVSEWWVPEGDRCPVFDSEEACETFCAQNEAICGGSTRCNFKTGPKRPECVNSGVFPNESGGWEHAPRDSGD